MRECSHQSSPAQLHIWRCFTPQMIKLWRRPKIWRVFMASFNRIPRASLESIHTGDRHVYTYLYLRATTKSKWGGVSEKSRLVRVETVAAATAPRQATLFLSVVLLCCLLCMCCVCVVVCFSWFEYNPQAFLLCALNVFVTDLCLCIFIWWCW